MLKESAYIKVSAKLLMMSNVVTEKLDVQRAVAVAQSEENPVRPNAVGYPRRNPCTKRLDHFLATCHNFLMQLIILFKAFNQN